MKDAARSAVKGARKGVERAHAKHAERTTLLELSEHDKADRARNLAVEAALKWLETPEEERKYDYAGFSKEGDPLGAGRLPDLVRVGLDLARDRGKSRDLVISIREKIRLEREADSAPSADRPPHGARVILELPGREEPPPLRIVDASAAEPESKAE